MDLCSQQNAATESMVAGVTLISDAYPNVKYKIEQLTRVHYFKNNIYVLCRTGEHNSFWNLNKFLFIAKFGFLTTLCFIRVLIKKPKKVYLPYPGFVLSFLFSLVPKTRRPLIYLDSFISVYDTVVLDRKLISSQHILSKMLYYFEKIAYANSKVVITDTRESAIYLSRLFKLPQCRFKECTLAQTPVELPQLKINKSPVLKCLFVGTFVPLQGVEVIAKAICSIKYGENIHITLIGNGQTAKFVERILKNADRRNYRWIKKWMTIEEIIEKIRCSDLCLGIFGNTNKTNRVWPYKNYLYLAAGCPVVTLRTPCAMEMKKKDSHAPIYFPEKPTSESLAQLLKIMAKRKDRLLHERKIARKFYENNLSNRIAYDELAGLIGESF